MQFPATWPHCFSHGDCSNACIGTLLQAGGIAEPVVLLFERVSFSLVRAQNGNAGLSIDAGDDDLAMRIERSTGLTLQVAQPAVFHEFRDAVEAVLRSGVPVGVTVDHYSYPQSPFHRSRHLPHKLVLCPAELPRRHFAYLDPYPDFRQRGVWAEDELRCLCDSEWLAESRLEMVYFRPSRLTFDADAYLRASWRSAVESNVLRMLSSGDHGRAGVEAISALAAEIEDTYRRIDDSELGLRGAFPVEAPLEVGRSREGHALWLARVGRLLGRDELLQQAQAFERIAVTWRNVRAVQIYLDKLEQSEIATTREFAVKLLKRVPSQLRSIATAEAFALRAVANEA